MKRTKNIDLSRMRKSSKHFHLKPLVIGLTAATLVACGGTRDAQVYKDIGDCVQDNPNLQKQCEAAYQNALAEAQKSGPKYRSERDCISDFGRDNCDTYTNSQGQSWFMPAMAGFMFSQLLNRNDYQSAPLYTSYSRFSPHYGKWSSVDGNLYGSRRYGKIKVGNDAFKPKPAVTRTMSRGGFGSTVSAKSRWAGSSSRSSWGG